MSDKDGAAQIEARIAEAFAAGQRCAYDDCIATAEIFERLLEGDGIYASLAVAADGGLADQLKTAKAHALLAHIPEPTP